MVLFGSLGLMATALMSAVTATATPNASDCLPIIDLGYELHRAASYNKETDAYLFSNVRYAKSPTGDLRFRHPVAPDVNRRVIQNGSAPRICPQAAPDWLTKSQVVAGKYFNPKNPFTVEAWKNDLLEAKPIPQDHFNDATTEDCLFLDIHVPRKVLQNTKKHHSKGSPVLVFIHGGGGVTGSKTGFPTPSFFPTGMLKEAAKHPDNLIFVSFNYRLGALGFLASEELALDGDLNNGNLDQRFALQWVQDHVHLFGGDKKRVTAMGESGGAARVFAQLTAYGGKKPALFHQAIPQSPGSFPTFKNPEGSYEGFLAHLNVSTLKEARELDSKTVITANAKQIQKARSTGFIFGTVLDGKLVPKPPVVLLKEGKFDHSVKIFTAHNYQEGMFFPDPTIETNQELREWAERTVVGLNKEDLDYLLETVYPAEFDGSHGYSTQFERQAIMMSEMLVDCNFLRLGELHKGNSYAYRFDISPGLHIQDLSYTFNNPNSPAPFPQAQLAQQKAIVTFAQTGIPQMIDGKNVPRWGSKGRLYSINEKGGEVGLSKVNRERCDWWRDLQFTL